MSSTADQNDNGNFEEIEVDVEDDDDSKSSGGDDLGSAFVGALSMTQFKLLISIFLIFLFISSDAFLDKILSRISGATDHRSPTTKGVMIQATIMVIMVLIIDLLIRAGFP